MAMPFDRTASEESGNLKGAGRKSAYATCAHLALPFIEDSVWVIAVEITNESGFSIRNKTIKRHGLNLLRFPVSSLSGFLSLPLAAYRKWMNQSDGNYLYELTDLYGDKEWEEFSERHQAQIKLYMFANRESIIEKCTIYFDDVSWLINVLEWDNSAANDFMWRGFDTFITWKYW